MNTMDLEIDGDIGILTLNRPDALNAMSPEMIGEFPVIFAWLADRAPLRALVITGAGFAFCAGGDINWFKKGLDDPDIDIVAGVRAGAEQMHQGIVEMQRIPYPVIAAVNGPAAGAGFSLALACDLRISSEAAVFVCAYGRIGASPDGGMTYFLPRVVGPAKAIELLLNDPNLSAQDALESGIVTEVVPADELIDRAKAKAETLAAKSPYYAKMAKELVQVSLDNNLTQHLHIESGGIANSMGTEDLQGAVNAFLDGDKAEFKGK
ncbi:MAG: enoyl-CoA hydratase/isomerase family protein [Solirubrobacterales bacterium]|nr:enoyl-CoA hydratase/isomerase family protein [Solirubrobacterales bacterium]